MRTFPGIAAAAATAAIALAGCGGSSGHTYPKNIQSNFLNACEANSTASRCGCILKNVEAHVSLHTFEVADRAVASGSSSVPSWLTSAVHACANK